MKIHEGFEVVCPDGCVRLYPYHNEDDAKCDAALLTERGCVSDPIGKQPKCPNGLHLVRAATMACPEGCVYDKFSSRTCERGTNGCTVKHGGSA